MGGAVILIGLGIAVLAVAVLAFIGARLGPPRRDGFWAAALVLLGTALLAAYLAVVLANSFADLLGDAAALLIVAPLMALGCIGAAVWLLVARKETRRKQRTTPADRPSAPPGAGNRIAPRNVVDVRRVGRR